MEPHDSVYQQLPTYEAATEKFYGLSDLERDSILAQLEALLNKHGLVQVVGVTIKHRHFTMPPGQVLLESQNAQAKESVMRPQSTSVPMIPFSFSLVDDQWMPFEFVEEGCKSAATGLEKVLGCPGFLEEYTQALLVSGVEDILGFQVLHRQHLGGEAHGTLETPGRAANELLIRPYTTKLQNSCAKDSSDRRQVGWSFTPKTVSGLIDGLICGVHWCQGHRCGSHCRDCSDHCVKH